MEEESQSRQEEPSEFIKKTGYYPASEPRVALVLIVMLGFSLLFSMGGAMLFQLIALLAGWKLARPCAARAAWVSVVRMRSPADAAGSLSG